MKTSILNLDKQFVNLKGVPLGEKMDEVLASQLALATTGDSNEMVNWAISLSNEGEVEMSQEDLIYLRYFVGNRQNLTNLAKSQLLDEIDKVLKELGSK